MQYSDTYYDNSQIFIKTIYRDKLIHLFKKFTITDEMLEYVNKENLPEINTEEILNEFSKFGIFSIADSQNLPRVLKRFTETQNLNNINNLLDKYSLSLTSKNFTSMLTKYCIENNYFSILNTLYLSKNFKLSEIDCKNPTILVMQDIKCTLQNLNSISRLNKNIIKVAHYLAHDKIDEYLSQNPIILLAILIFSNIKFDESLIRRGVVIEDLVIKPELISNFFNNFNLANEVYKIMKNLDDTTCTLYEILEHQLPENCKQIFSFRYDTQKEIPTFSSILSKDLDIYKKTVNYLVYIKQYRPCIALRRFIIDHLKTDPTFCLDQVNKNEVLDKLFKITLKKRNDVSLISSCVAFLEMLQIDTLDLRVTIKSVNICPNNLTNGNQEILKTLELDLVKKHLSDLGNVSNLQILLRDFDVLVKYSRMHKLKLPEIFLSHCCKRNIWILYLIIIQMYNYPIEQALNIASSFTSFSLNEHLNNCLVNMYCDVLSRENKIKNSLEEKTKRRISHEQLIDSEIYLPCNETFLSILTKCHRSLDPPRALLKHSIMYKSPLIVLCATCYEV